MDLIPFTAYKKQAIKGDDVEDVKKLVGNRIRQLRKGKGLSQEELGYKSELHYTHIGAIERGEKNWSIETLVKVVRIPAQAATRFRLKSPPDSVSFRHPIPGESAT